MNLPPTAAATTAAELRAVEEAVRGRTFPLAALRPDPAGRVVIPFERAFPRRESFELVVRGVRAVRLEDARVQATDEFRALRWDPAARALAVECVLVRAVLAVESLRVEVLPRTPRERTGLDVGDLPAPLRREIEEAGTARVRLHERHDEAERRRRRAMPALGSILSVVLGALAGPTWWLLVLHALLGAGIGAAMAARRWSGAPAGAAVFGAPVAALAVIGSRASGAPLTKALGFAMIAVAVGAALAGVLLGHLHGRMMERSGEEAWSGAVRGPAGSSDPRLPGRAAILAGSGAALLLALVGGPPLLWTLAAPAASGSAAWFLARTRAPAERAGALLGTVGLGLAAVSFLLGATILPAVPVVAALHFVGGMLVAYYSRGEGPPERAAGGGGAT